MYGQSMESTLRDRDRVIINKLVYHLYTPSREILLCLKTRPITKKTMLRGLYGVAGDTIEIADHKVYINGQLLNEPYLDGNRK